MRVSLIGRVEKFANVRFCKARQAATGPGTVHRFAAMNDSSAAIADAMLGAVWVSDRPTAIS